MEMAVMRREQPGARRQGVNNLLGYYFISPPSPWEWGRGGQQLEDSGE